MATKMSSFQFNSFFSFLLITTLLLSFTSLEAARILEDNNLQQNGSWKTTEDDNGQGKGSVGPSTSGHAGSETGGSNSPPSGTVTMPPPATTTKKMSSQNVTNNGKGVQQVSNTGSGTQTVTNTGDGFQQVSNNGFAAQHVTNVGNGTQEVSNDGNAVQTVSNNGNGVQEVSNGGSGNAVQNLTNNGDGVQTAASNSSGSGSSEISVDEGKITTKDNRGNKTTSTVEMKVVAKAGKAPGSSNSTAQTQTGNNNNMSLQATSFTKESNDGSRTNHNEEKSFSETSSVETKQHYNSKQYSNIET